jgi:hypothetical protein
MRTAGNSFITTLHVTGQASPNKSLKHHGAEHRGSAVAVNVPSAVKLNSFR